MSKHNNSLSKSSHAKCYCGRYATIGDWKMGIGLNGNYVCPDCQYHKAQHEHKKRMASGVK